MARLTKEQREPLRDAVAENAVRYWANPFICERITALLDTADALEAELAALTEKMPCGHPKACRVAAGTSIAEPAYCTACADRDAHVRLEVTAALHKAARGIADVPYTAPTKDYVNAILALIPAADASALAEHDAALLEKYTKINHLLIGSSARDFAEKFFHGHIDFVGSMQPTVKIKGFISALENAVQMFVDAHVQQKVAAHERTSRRLIAEVYGEFVTRGYIPSAPMPLDGSADTRWMKEAKDYLDSTASPSGDRGGAASDGGDKSEGAR